MDGPVRQSVQQQFQWEDRSELVVGEVYYYWLEDVDIYGATSLQAESAPVGPAWWWIALAALALAGYGLWRRQAV